VEESTNLATDRDLCICVQVGLVHVFHPIKELPVRLRHHHLRSLWRLAFGPRLAQSDHERAGLFLDVELKLLIACLRLEDFLEFHGCV